LSEAEFFAEAGFDDILYGYPLMEHHMERNYVLADKLDEYHVMVASNESVDLLLKMDPPAGKKWFIFNFLLIFKI
jgi:D-serine deaminase-like pyridoxal phosphate-dependent protein